MKTPRPLGCDEVVRLLLDFLSRELDGDRRSEVEQHLDLCRACFSRAEFEKRLRSELGQLAREEAPPAVKARIKNLLRGF